MSCNCIGILGGTFDPVHIGHLRSAEEVRQRLEITDFRFLPARHPPHRRDYVTPAHHRLAMLERALAGYEGFSIDRRELERTGPSYMADTLAGLHREFPNSTLLLIIGQDSANTLDAWHEWRSLFGLAHIVVMQRPDHPDRYAPELSRELAGRTVTSAGELFMRTCGLVMGVDVTQLQVSSSEIRDMVRTGRSPRFLVPDPVRQYIDTERLYRREPA